jgi:hypothetical protein
MADSIISRGQGIASTTADSSIFLQVGTFQNALLGLLESPFSRCGKQDYASFLMQGTESIVTRVSNATADTSLPLDRLSLGKGLLTQYVIILQLIFGNIILTSKRQIF